MTFADRAISTNYFDAALDVIAPRQSEADAHEDIAIAAAYAAAVLPRMAN